MGFGMFEAEDCLHHKFSTVLVVDESRHSQEILCAMGLTRVMFTCMPLKKIHQEYETFIVIESELESLKLIELWRNWPASFNQPLIALQPNLADLN